MPLPTPSELTDPNVTEAQFKNGLIDLLNSILSKQEINSNALFKPVALTSNSDLNDYISTGLYYLTYSEYASTSRNFPAAAAGVLRVQNRGANLVHQEYITTSNIFTRALGATEWTAWTKFATEKTLQDANDALAQSLQNYTDARAERACYILSGFITKQRVVNSEAVEITFTDLTIAKGAGNGFARVLAGTYTLAIGQALYVDLDSTPVNNRYTPQLTVTAGDLGYLAMVEGKDAFFKDRKILLFINDLYGYGGLLAGKNKHTNRPVGDIWLKNGLNKVYFDATTRTLSWSGTFVLPNRGLNRRYSIEAGSVTFVGGGLQTAYIDLNLAAANGNIPPEAVKVGTYTGVATTESFENLGNQLPFYIYNSAIDGEHYPVGGFPTPKIINQAVAYNNLDDDDIIVFVGSSAIDVYMKGSKRLSQKYTDWRIIRKVAPFNPSDPLGNADCWRIDGIYEADKPQSSFGFTRTRDGQTIVSAGEIECAILEDGKGDFMGGWHGDEVLTSFYFLLDGKLMDTSVSASYVCKKFELIQVSDLFRMNTQTKVADHSKHLIFENRKLRLKHYVKWAMSLVIKAAYLTMLPIKRKLYDTYGQQITDTAIRSPNFVLENIAEANFERTLTIGSLPTCRIWGTTGVEASVEFLKHPNNPTACFYIANPTNYNKLYYSVAGNFIGTERHTTTVGEIWETDSLITVNTSL